MVRSLVSKFVNATKGAPLWIEAFENMAKEEWSAAKATLNEYSKYAPRNDPQYFLAEALVSYKLDDYAASCHFLELARRGIDEGEKYSIEEKNYLHCYADRLAEKIYVDKDFAEFFGDFSALRFEKVRSVLKLNFPLSLGGKGH
ncbi:MAG: hypothetical protein WDZ30_01495 [Cellvibrionaceae bacterium]